MPPRSSLRSLALFCALALLLGLTGKARADDLDDSMAQYMQAIRSGDVTTFLHFLSQENNWRFVSYRTGTSNIVSTTSFSYQQTADQLGQQGGLYSALFDGTPVYRYRDRLARHPLSTWRRDDNNYRLPDTEGISFVRWKKEEGRWVIDSIGDDSP